MDRGGLRTGKQFGPDLTVQLEKLSGCDKVLPSGLRSASGTGSCQHRSRA